MAHDVFAAPIDWSKWVIGAISTDGFAGWGGFSLGLKLAGFGVYASFNHWKVAVAMHQANNPETMHFCEDIREIDPRLVLGDVRIDFAVFAPDCTHHSVAKGGKPRDNKLRGLAEVIVNPWAKTMRPRCILVENVPEFRDWGPLDEHGKPIKERKGESFRAWVKALEDLGYTVEWRVLKCHEYGAPTSRERLFVVARLDGKPAWPGPTHGPGLLPVRTAAQCIDFSIPTLSVFATKDEARAFSREHGCGIPKRPLAENTMRRIARGLFKFVIGSARPFVVPVTHPHDQRVHSIDEPLRTVTSAHRGELALVAPVFTKAHNHGWDRPGSRSDEPLHTVTATEEHALIAPTLVQTGQGERVGQAPRCLDLQKPLGTVVGCGQRHGLVAAFLARNYSERPTGGWPGGVRLDVPAPTVTAHRNAALVTSHLSILNENTIGQDVRAPMQTVVAGATRFAEVRAFLTKFYGQGVGQDLNDPMGTVTARDRFGLVVVDGVDYEIVDIGFRMLTPRELARAQGFPDSYKLDTDPDGRRLTLEEQVRLVGNAVPPPVVEALVRANVARAAA